MGNILSNDDVFKGCCCDMKLVIIASKNLESVLEKEFGATGRGLHEKISSVQDIPPDIQRKLRKIATIRNKLIHDVGYDSVENQSQFKSDFHDCVIQLQAIAKARGKSDPFAFMKCVIC